MHLVIVILGYCAVKLNMQCICFDAKGLLSFGDWSVADNEVLGVMRGDTVIGTLKWLLWKLIKEFVLSL